MPRINIEGVFRSFNYYKKIHDTSGPGKMWETVFKDYGTGTVFIATLGYFLYELVKSFGPVPIQHDLSGPAVDGHKRVLEYARQHNIQSGLPYWKQAGYVAPDTWRQGMSRAIGGAVRETVKKGFSLGSWGASSTLRDISPIIAPAIFGLSFALTSEFKNFFDWIKRTVGDPEVVNASDFIENYGPSIRSRTYMQGLTVEDRQNYWRLYNMAREATGMGELKYPYADLDIKQEGTDIQRYEETMQFGKAQQVLEEDKLNLAYDNLPEDIKSSMASRGIDKTLYVAYMRMKNTGVPQSFLDSHFPQFGADVERLDDQFMTYSDVMNLLLDNEISSEDLDQPLYDIPPEDIEFPWKSEKHFSYKE